MNKRLTDRDIQTYRQDRQTANRRVRDIEKLCIPISPDVSRTKPNRYVSFQQAHVCQKHTEQHGCTNAFKTQARGMKERRMGTGGEGPPSMPSSAKS